MIYASLRWVDGTGKTITATLNKVSPITIEEQNMRINVCYMPGSPTSVLDKHIHSYFTDNEGKVLYIYEQKSGSVVTIRVEEVMFAYTYNHHEGGQSSMKAIIKNGKSLLPGEERLNVNEQELIGRIDSQRQTIGELHKEKTVLEIRAKDLENINLGRIDEQRQVIGQLEAQISDLEELCGERLNRIDEQRKLLRDSEEAHNQDLDCISNQKQVITKLQIDLGRQQGLAERLRVRNKSLLDQLEATQMRPTNEEVERLKVKLEVSLAAEESLKKQRDKLQNQMEFLANRASTFASGKKGPGLSGVLGEATQEVKEVKANFTWPLGIHPAMDKMARRWGYSHWCCTSPGGNGCWMRRDGRVLEINIGEGIADALGEFDSKNPIGGFMFPMSKE